MKVLVAIDSFKGSLSSIELANSIEIGIKKVYKNSKIIKVPIADGGEGSVESLVYATKGEFIDIEVNNPLMHKIVAKYGLFNNRRSAIIEMASASGLTLIPKDKQNPLLTTTYGTGELIKNALKKGCRDFILCIGGSATNDAGMGMLDALGVNFYDKQGNKLEGIGKNLIHIDKIDISNMIEELKDSNFLIACDVDNTLYGKNGASYIYAKQKGATYNDIIELDKGLQNFANIVKQNFNIDISNIKGSGAAGGLGGGAIAFLNAQLKSGVDIILNKINIKDKLKNVDIVITGEGKIDKQTIMGKAPIGVAKIAKEQNIPVVAITGNISKDAKIVHKYIDAIFSIIQHPISHKKAMKSQIAKNMVTNSIEEIFRLIKINI